jgi:signal transduction histidine kinase
MHRTSKEAVVLSATERRRLEAEYRVETSGLIGRVLPWAVAAYVAIFCVVVATEWFYQPERRPLLLARFGADLGVCLLAALAARWAPAGRIPVLVGVTLLCVISLFSGAYNLAIGGRAERYALAQLCIMNGAALLVPWGWRPQLGVLLGSLASFALVGPHMVSSDATGYMGLVLVIGGTISVAAALFIDRYRFHAFLRVARDREEAEIAATLLAASRALAPHAEATHILAEASRLAVEALGCAWIAALRWDAAAGGYVLAAERGMPVPLRLALGASARPAEHLAERFGATQLVSATLLTGTDAPVALVAAFGTDGDPPPRAHRLLCGIAEAASVALENARVIADLERASRLKSEFVSTMSHELRSPLHVILGSVEMLRDPALSVADRTRCLERADGAGRELLGLIDDTLELGRIDAGLHDLRLAPVPLQRLWGELRVQCAGLPRRVPVALAWDDDVPALTILTDARKLGAVVRNLVHNALKFTLKGQVRVAVAAEPDALAIHVADTGIGIRAEDRDSIFEMFRQADGSDTRAFGGAGLGLHIVRRFVDELGGKISVTSALGEGSVFTVRLPLRAAGAA